MKSIYQNFLKSVLFVNVFLGMLLNAFIVVMNGKTWLTTKSLPPGDKIVTSLCVSRWIYLFVGGFYNILRLFYSKEDLGYFNSFLALGRVSTNYISIWIASLLCVYYCVKIATYKHAVFLYLKEKMPMLTPWFLGLCVFFPLMLSLPYGFRFFSVQFKASTLHIIQNTTMHTIAGTYFIGSSPPFIIFGIAFFLTVPSLCRHIRNMSCDGASFRCPDMKTHYNAIKSMAAFFLLHIFFIVCVNIDLSGVVGYGGGLMPMLDSFYPLLHSAVIIFYNRKLKQGFLVLVTCCLRFGQ